MGFSGTQYLGGKKPFVRKYREPDKWAKENAQVRILTGRGSSAYFLPEKKNEGRGKVYADTVIDGEITEFKTVSGNRSTLGTDFKPKTGKVKLSLQ